MGAKAEPKNAGAGGRQVLGTALGVLAALWLAYTAWSAGRTLVGQPLTSPLIAQWVAVAAGPLALHGTRLADVRPHPAQGSGALHPVGRSRCAARAQSLEALLEVAVAANPRQPDRADDDLAASDAAWRRCDRQARRDHARIRQQQREAATPRRGARPRRRNRAHRHRRAARGPAARRANGARRLAEQLRVGRQRIGAEGRGIRPAGQRARRAHARGRPDRSPRRPIGSPRGWPRSKAAGAAAARARRRSAKRLIRGRSTRCSTARRRRSSEIRIGHRRPGGGGRGAGRAGLGRDRQGRRRKPPNRSRPMSTMPAARSTACRAGSPSRTAPRSG